MDNNFMPEKEVIVYDATYSLAKKTGEKLENNIELWGEVDSYKLVLFGYLAKNIHKMQSIRLLAENGFAKDAAALVRGIFEDLVDLKYMSDHPEVIVEFFNFDLYQRWKLKKNIPEGHGSKKEVEDRGKELESELVKNKSRFSDLKSHLTWRDKDLRQLSRNYKLEEVYDNLVSYLSNFIHSSPIALNHFVQVSANTATVKMQAGPSSEMVAAILLTTTVLVHDILNLFDRTFHLDIASSLQSISDETEQIRKNMAGMVD